MPKTSVAEPAHECTQLVIIPAGKARPISNGSLIANCPFHETGKPVLTGMRPFFICFGCGRRGPFTANETG